MQLTSVHLEFWKWKHLLSEIKREKMSSATPRRHLSKDDKLAIIEASKSPAFSKEEAMKNGE